MTTMPIQLVVFIITSFAGALMLMQGVSVHMLERRQLRCQVCGGVIGRSCTCARGH